MTTTPRAAALMTLAAVLPLVAICVPVLRWVGYPGDKYDYGADLLSPDALIVAAALWLPLLVAALLCWHREARWATLAVVGGAIWCLIAVLFSYPGEALWDGVDGNGRPTGGMARSMPWVGTWLLYAAGVCAICAGSLRFGALARARNPMPNADSLG